MGAAVYSNSERNRGGLLRGTKVHTSVVFHEEMDVFHVPPHSGQIWREPAVMEVSLQILACLLLPTLPKGCNNQLLVCAAAPCEMAQQEMFPWSSLLGHMPLVGP